METTLPATAIPKQIPHVGWLRSTQVIVKNRAFYPAIGEYFRDHVGGLVSYYLRGRRYFVTDPALAQKVMRVDFKRAVKPLDPYDALQPWQGNGLVLSEGAEWIKQRRWASPFFISAAFPAYLKIMREETDALAEEWARSAGKPIQVVPTLNRATFRILCRCILGKVLDSHLDKLYRGIDETIFLTPQRVFAAVRFPLHYPTPLNRKMGRSAKEYRGVIAEIIEDVRKDPKPGLLSHLLKQTDITQDDMIDMISTMIGAGFETTANLLSWTFATLAQNQAAQDKVRRELKAVAATGPTLEAIEGARYLEAVINESLRLYPPILVPGRKFEEDIELDGHFFKKGSQVDVSIWALHRHPDYWDQPTEFIPERFLDENITDRQRQAFMPFAVGPRECVGKAFALLEARTVLTILLSRFSFTLAPDALIVPESSLVLRPRYGVKLVCWPSS